MRAWLVPPPLLLLALLLLLQAPGGQAFGFLSRFLSKPEKSPSPLDISGAKIVEQVGRWWQLLHTMRFIRGGADAARQFPRSPPAHAPGQVHGRPQPRCDPRAVHGQGHAGAQVRGGARGGSRAERARRAAGATPRPLPTPGRCCCCTLACPAAT